MNAGAIMNLGIPKRIEDSETIELNVYTPSGNKKIGVIRVNYEAQVAEYVPEIRNRERGY